MILLTSLIIGSNGLVASIVTLWERIAFGWSREVATCNKLVLTEIDGDGSDTLVIKAELSGLLRDGSIGVGSYVTTSLGADAVLEIRSAGAGALAQALAFDAQSSTTAATAHRAKNGAYPAPGRLSSRAPALAFRYYCEFALTREGRASVILKSVVVGWGAPNN